MPKKGNYAWDTGVLLAWLSEEATAPLADIVLVVAAIDTDEANLILSVNTVSEVLEAKNTAEQMQQFTAFPQRSNVVTHDVSLPIATKAGEIRSACLKE